MNGARIPGSWEATVTTTGPESPMITRPLEVILSRLACSGLTWFAVSRLTATGNPQVTCMYSGLRRDSTRWRAPGPTKTVPTQ